MVVTYYIKLLRTAADKHNGILMSLPLLVAEIKMNFCVKTVFCNKCKHIDSYQNTEFWEVGLQKVFSNTTKIL